MQKLEDLSEDQKKQLFEMRAEIKVYSLIQLTQIVDVASQRGAFKGEELSLVGSLFDSLKNGINKAVEVVKDEKKDEKKEPAKLSPVIEEESS